MSNRIYSISESQLQKNDATTIEWLFLKLDYYDWEAALLWSREHRRQLRDAIEGIFHTEGATVTRHSIDRAFREYGRKVNLLSEEHCRTKEEIEKSQQRRRRSIQTPRPVPFPEPSDELKRQYGNKPIFYATSDGHQFRYDPVKKVVLPIFYRHDIIPAPPLAIIDMDALKAAGLEHLADELEDSQSPKPVDRSIKPEGRIQRFLGLFP